MKRTREGFLVGGPIQIAGRTVVALGLVAALSLSACSSCKQAVETKAAVKDAISLLPKDVNFVAGLNFDKARGTAIWQKFVDLQKDSPEQKARLDEFTLKTGLDPFKQIDSALVALPASSTSGEFLAILRGGPFDEAKLVAYLKEQHAKDGGEVVTSDYAGKKLYTDNRAGQTFVAFLDNKTAVVAGKEWIKKVVDLSQKPGESVKDNAPLFALLGQAKTSEAAWAVGLVPEDVRAKLRDDPRLAAAGTMKDFQASVDFRGGFTLAASVGLAGESDAKELAGKINEQIGEAKRNPQLLMLGMSSYFDAVKADAVGASFHLDVKLTQQQVDDLIARLTGLFKSFGGGGPGMGGPGMGGPGMGPGMGGPSGMGGMGGPGMGGPPGLGGGMMLAPPGGPATPH